MTIHDVDKGLTTMVRKITTQKDLEELEQLRCETGLRGDALRVEFWRRRDAIPIQKVEGSPHDQSMFNLPTFNQSGRS